MLKSHEVVIFSLRINNSADLLASASDDRSIRLWNINDVKKSHLVRIIYGHQARIWDCIFINTRIASVSEVHHVFNVGFDVLCLEYRNFGANN